MTLAELADASGIPPRTVRFYIARGLLEGPEVAGRGATYGPGHLERLQKIRSTRPASKAGISPRWPASTAMEW
jgi:DNA-binding transcriptional MerR regulator